MATIERARHYSEADLTGLAGHSQVGVISITEPDKYVKLLDDDSWPFILRLYFHDIDKQWQNYVLFTEEQADQIIDFLKEHEDDMTGVYTHCAAGISRSAAVTRFVADLYGLFFDEKKGRFYNKHVYRTLLERALARGIITREEMIKRIRGMEEEEVQALGDAQPRFT
jgi:hypothetical protein